MIKPRIIQRQPETSPFLGIGTGKRKRAKAEAEAKIIAAQTEAKLKLMAAEVEAAKTGYKTEEQQKTEAQLIQTTTEVQSTNTLYYVLAAIVIAVLIALYLIKKR